MRILLTEPVTTRYIYIASETNKVHLLVPIETSALKEFFDGGAIGVLNKYKSALVLDLLLLEDSDPRRTAKKERLTQIENYIKAIIHMKDSYGHVIRTFKARSPLAEARYVLHQHATCVNFADIIDPTAAFNNPDYFENVRKDFACHPDAIPDSNESIVSDFIAVASELLLLFSDEQRDQLLPPVAKEECRADPAFRLLVFLGHVAKATPDKTDLTLIKNEAEALLKAATPEYRQTLLRTPGRFTDYSGRTFHCTAFEYAYWAKDAHMCKMLVSHMNEETKAQILARITANIADGLRFQQHGMEHRSPHFDLTPLKTVLQGYVVGFAAWAATRNWDAMNAAWLAVGKAQRGLPVHIMNEYCRDDWSFSFTPHVNDVALPRALTFFNCIMAPRDALFHLGDSNSGLGFNFSLVRTREAGRASEAVRGSYRSLAASYRSRAAKLPPGPSAVVPDLDAISRLDQVRTVDLTHLREALNPPASIPSSGLLL